MAAEAPVDDAAVLKISSRQDAKAPRKAIRLGVLAAWRELSWLLVSIDMEPVLQNGVMLQNRPDQL